MTIQTHLISGAAGSLGTAVVQILLGRGHRVVATDLDLERLTATAKRLCWDKERLVMRSLDVTAPSDWDRVIEELSATATLDIAIHCAGHIQGAPFWEQSPEEVQRHLEVNTLGVLLGTRACAEVMVRQGHGHILNIASMAALMPSPGFAYYSGAKYAVRGFSLAAAAELAPKGVAVTVICPATIQGPMYASQKDYYDALQGELASPPMPLDAVVKAMLAPKVFKRRPLEVHVPPLKGAVARGADLFPSAFTRVMNRLRGRSRGRGEGRE